MKILNNAVIKDRYDCIVVGAGIGGLTAAALLAKKGVDTLLIEQHYLPGGACGSLKWMGQTFDTGAALLFGFGSGGEGFAPHRYVMNVLEEPLNMIQHDSIYRCNWRDENGKLVQVTFWQDFELFIKELIAAFPEHEEGLRNFYDYLEGKYQTILKLDSPVPISEQSLLDKMKMFFKDPLGTFRLLKLINTDMKTVMEKYLPEDPRIHTFFDLLLSLMLTTRTYETPVLMAAAIFIVNFHGGACYPQGAPQTLSNTLERNFERNGGSVLYRHLVDEILIENKKAYGVRLANGTEILAENVISDASIWQNYNKLINRKHLTQERIEWANRFKPTISGMIMYIGVKAEAIPEGTRAIEMYIEDISNYEGGVAVLYIPSMDDPSICPEGTHSITVLAQLFKEFPRPGDPEYQSEAYYKLKEEETNRILDTLEKYLPKLRENIICMEVGTPATIERFTLRDWGAIGGPKQALGQHMLKRLHAKSEFKNLFFVGDSTTMGEGVLSVTLSAVGGANMVLKEEGIKPYKNQKFEGTYINFVEGQPRTPLPGADEELDEKKASRAAFECQWCREIQCVKNCPAGVDVPSFMRRIESGSFSAAARQIRQMNPLGEICGIICPHERLCQKNCYHLEFSNEPVRIGQLQSWVCKRAGEGGWDNNVEDLNGIKVAVVGAGSAGLACAYYLGRLGYGIDVFEKRDKMGGMISHVIPPSRLPADVVARDLKGITLPTINFKYGMELGRDIKVSQLSEEYDAVFLAPGLWAGRKLNLPGLDPDNVTDALSLIREYNEKGRVELKGQVLVIGGGSVAADAVLVAKESGVSDIKMICLEAREEMPALKAEIEEILEWGIDLENSWGPMECVDGKLSCMECTSVFDEDGNFAPKFNESKSKEFEFDHIIMAVGQEMEAPLKEYLKEEFGEIGFIEVNPETQQVAGKLNVFAGGDIIRGAGTVVQSVADGRRAAMAIDSMLKS